jgi:hypothetical protein
MSRSRLVVSCCCSTSNQQSQVGLQQQHNNKHLTIRNRKRLKGVLTNWKNATNTIAASYINLIMLGGRIERSSSSKCFLLLSFIVLIAFLGTWQLYTTDESAYKIFKWDIQHGISAGSYSSNDDDNDLSLMQILIKNGAYRANDFVNIDGVVPPYWDDELIPKHPSETTTESLGPCFLSHDSIKWDREAQRSRLRNMSDYPTSGLGPNKNDWANYCLPGFLIIGAGKCGTSVRFVLHSVR